MRWEISLKISIFLGLRKEYFWAIESYIGEIVFLKITPHSALYDMGQEASSTASYISYFPCFFSWKQIHETIEKRDYFLPMHVFATSAKCLSKIIILNHITEGWNSVREALTEVFDYDFYCLVASVVFSHFSVDELIFWTGKGAHLDILLYLWIHRRDLGALCSSYGQMPWPLRDILEPAAYSSPQDKNHHHPIRAQ